MIINYQGKEVKLPDFLIAGTARSGTTSLYYYLRQHPQIFMAENKEPMFFTFAGENKDTVNIYKHLYIITDFYEYLNLFEDSKDSQVLGEASTSYLHRFNKTIENIKKYHPGYKELKIIIILRKPAERAFSHYLLHYKDKQITTPFKELLKKQGSGYHDYIDCGFYYNQVKAYKDNFKNIRIYLFDDLEKNTMDIVKDIFNFLDVYPDVKIDADTKTNISGIPKNKLFYSIIRDETIVKPLVRTLLPFKIRQKWKAIVYEKLLKRQELDEDTKHTLMGIYRDDILRLQDLINKDLSAWLKV